MSMPLAAAAAAVLVRARFVAHYAAFFACCHSLPAIPKWPGSFRSDLRVHWNEGRAVGLLDLGHGH